MINDVFNRLFLCATERPPANLCLRCYFVSPVLPEGSQRGICRSTVKPAAILGNVRSGEARFMYGSERVQSLSLRALLLPLTCFGSSTLRAAGLVAVLRVCSRRSQHLRQHPPQLLGSRRFRGRTRCTLAGVALHLRGDHVRGSHH